MNLTFRAAVPGDAPELKRLNDAFNGPGEKTAEAMAADLASPGCEQVFVAGVDSRIIGFCCCHIKKSFCYGDLSAELTELYVEPEFRRKGTASGLLALAQDYCAGLGVSEFTLLTGSGNLGARAFYERLGFAATGEVHYGKEL